MKREHIQLVRDTMGDYALMDMRTLEIRWVWLSGRPTIQSWEGGFKEPEIYFDRFIKGITTIEQAHRCIPYL